MKLRTTAGVLVAAAAALGLLFSAGCPFGENPFEKDYSYKSVESKYQAGRYLNGYDKEQREMVEPEITVWENAERTDEMGTFPDGTEVTVLGFTSQTPQMMQIRLPDGRTGWIPAGKIRKKPRP